MDSHKRRILAKIIRYKAEINDVLTFIDNVKKYGGSSIEIEVYEIELNIFIKAKDDFEKILNKYYGDNDG